MSFLMSSMGGGARDAPHRFNHAAALPRLASINAVKRSNR
jgi:hypothetical protein